MFRVWLCCGGDGEFYSIGSIDTTFQCINRLKVEIDLNIIKISFPSSLRPLTAIAKTSCLTL